MRILIDTNVILDIVLERQPFIDPAVRLLRIAQETDVEIFLTATTITDLYYITRKARGRTVAFDFIKDLLQFTEIAGVDKKVIVRALRSEIDDLEDAIQESAAIDQAIDTIVTRNTRDFSSSQLEIHTPESFLSSLQ